jgi:hypothetical protein
MADNIAPMSQAAAKKDPKLANNWKTNRRRNRQTMKP